MPLLLPLSKYTTSYKAQKARLPFYKILGILFYILEKTVKSKLKKRSVI